MRILQQCIYFPPEVGGLESHAYYLCRELVRDGHAVTMVTSRSRRGLARREVMGGIDVQRYWMPARNTVGWAAHTFATVPAVLRLAREADVIHAHTFASAVPGMAAKRRFGVPLVVTLHTSHFLRLAGSAAWRPVLRRIISAADWLLASSEEIRDVALGLHPHPRAEALTNGVDTELFRPLDGAAPADGRRRLIVPRRLYAKNGVEFAIRALPLMAERLDVELVVVGDGPERPRLERLAAELGVGDRARFLGARPNAEMPALLAGADAAIVPSLVEATSVAALEAMSCAIPVAASRVGGLPEIVDDDVGTLFRAGDPEDLAEKVVELLRRPDLRHAGERARARVVERWSIAALARRHEEIYGSLTTRKM